MEVLVSKPLAEYSVTTIKISYAYVPFVVFPKSLTFLMDAAFISVGKII